MRTAVAVVAVVALAGCAARTRVPAGPIVSPTGIVYPKGLPPVGTRYSQTAALYMVRGHLDRALAIALEGVAADSLNPIHHFLAGSAAVRLGRHVEADRLFAAAERLYPAYQLQIEPERLAAWTHAYDDGVAAFSAGDAAGATTAWESAAVIYDLRADAHRNLASMRARDGEYDAAIDAYRRALAGLEKRPATRVLDEAALAARSEAIVKTEESLAQLLVFVNRLPEAEPLLRRQVARDSTNVQAWSDLASALKALGRDAEAAAIYGSLLSGTVMETTELFNLGVGLFRAGDYQQASEAFARLTTMRPRSRDAWFNYANSLFAAQAWTPLAAAGERLVELDPLGKNVGLIAARAALEAGDQEGALRGLQRVDGAPVYVEGLQMRPFDARSTVVAQVVGNAAAAGSPVRLRFTFYDDATELGSEVVDVAAPAREEAVPLEVSFPGRATGFSYAIVP